MIDCMACLLALAQGLPGGGVFTDERGITHATLRTQFTFFLTCTTKPDPVNPGRALIDWTRAKRMPR